MAEQLGAAAPDLTLKAHDTYPPLQVVLSDANGPINLTAASQVRVIMKGTTGGSIALVTGVMTISASPVGGFAAYTWAAGDTAIPNTYNVEFEIAWTTGGIETVPNDIYRTVQINQDLENV
jgi:hypothetical protein